MQPLAVDASLLRTVLATDIKLAVGRELMVRIAALTGEGRGTLSLAGMMLDAELPANVRAGDELRLQVREITPDRVVLAIQDDAQQVQAAPLADVPATPLPMPQGGSVQVTERDGRGVGSGGGESQTLSLRYDAPNLGPIEMRFSLSSGALALTLNVAPIAYALADANSSELQSKLTDVAARPAKVTITSRREPIEVFA